MMSKMLTLALRAGPAMAVALGLTPMLSAQQEERPERQGSEARSDQGAQDDEQDRRRGGEAQRQQGRRGDEQGRRAPMRLQPEGWVRVAIDYDSDGKIDRVESIFLFDLEQATRASAKRRQSGRMREGRGMPPIGSMGRRAVDRVQGTIQDVRTTRLAGVEGEEHVLARVETEDGRTARVHMGTTSQLAEIDPKSGDEVTVFGVRGLVNDRPMLMARRIEADGQTLDVQLPEDRALRRFRGELTSTRTTSIRNRDGEFVVGRIRIQNGRELPAILGSTDELGDLDPSEGDSVTLLARPGRLNGRPALVAEQIRSGDQTVITNQPDRRRFRTEGRQGRGRRGQSNRQSGDNQPDSR